MAKNGDCYVLTSLTDKQHVGGREHLLIKVVWEVNRQGRFCKLTLVEVYHVKKNQEKL